jgi:hypothetical protein
MSPTKPIRTYIMVNQMPVQRGVLIFQPSPSVLYAQPKVRIFDIAITEWCKNERRLSRSAAERGFREMLLADRFTQWREKLTVTNL